MKRNQENPDLAGAFLQLERPLSGFVLCLVIVAVWSWVYGRTSLTAWQTPLGYGGDAWLGLGFAKAFMDGDIVPFLQKSVAHLNAPFTANWNDYPLTEEFIFAFLGWLGRGVGLFPAANIMVMIAHVLAGFSFWYVSRELKYRPAFAFSGALLFAFSPYSFARNLWNITLTYYWHVPLILLVTWWAYSSEPVESRSRKWFTAIVIAVVSGTLNPYYSWIFLQFLGFAVLLHLVRKQYHLIPFPLLLSGVIAASFLMMNADTLSYSLLHGTNKEAIARNLASLELYALKIPDLVFPPVNHSWQSWANYGQSHYFLLTMIKGEVWSPYLGMIGLAGLTWLGGTGVYLLLQGNPQQIPVHLWQTLWVLLYALVGGLNLLLGTFGFVLFRCTNRYSIVILAIVLLFLVRQLSHKCPEKLVLFVALGIAVIGLWDQLPQQVPAVYVNKIAALVQSDRTFSQRLEAQLPENSMVFQLPVIPFPEYGHYNQMEDYEHLRPYLHTRRLHFSYGTNKGRGDAAWQNSSGGLAPAEMAAELETYGFGAIVINRKGYEDKGARLIRGLVDTGRAVLADNGELVAIGLKPVSAPALPKAPIPVARIAPLAVFKQNITASAPVRTLQANETAAMQVTVKNIGNEPWPSKGSDEKGANRVGLGFHWFDNTGMVIREGRTLLPHDLMPGSSALLDVKIEAPSQAGDYTVRFSMVQEHVAWFSDKGAGSYEISVAVK